MVGFDSKLLKSRFSISCMIVCSESDDCEPDDTEQTEISSDVVPLSVHLRDELKPSSLMEACCWCSLSWYYSLVDCVVNNMGLSPMKWNFKLW